MDELRPIIIKLGGSVITDKTKSRGVFRKNVVARLAGEIATVRRKKNFNLVLVHGAGSYGHPLAKKYSLDKGDVSKESLKGFSLVKKLVLDLSLLVSQEFIEKGLNVSIVQPSAVISTSKGKIKTFDVRYIGGLLQKKIIPILFGDVILDDAKGFSIISGDIIVAHLAKILNALKVVFVSDVEGVFDKNPKIYKDAKLIKVIDYKNFDKIITQRTNNQFDVTDEMKGKLLAIKKGLKGADVAIVNGLVRSVLEKSLLGDIKGTRFIF